MILKNVNMKDFIKVIANKKVYIYGCGKNFNELLHNYSSLLTNADIGGVIDAGKIGNKITINGNDYTIISPEQFRCSADNKNVVLLITIHFCEEIYKKYNSLSEYNDVECYMYEWIRNLEYDKILYSVKLSKDVLEHSVMQIPKKIHYCWFGDGEMSELNKKCIESWKKFCPDYEIILWNEDNYDITKNKYMYDAYKAKKWGFVPDYARFDIIYNHGGIYLDTDVELLKSLDPLLYEKGFCGYDGIESVNFGLGFGAVSKNKTVKKFMDHYDNLDWDDGTITSNVFQSQVLKNEGLSINTHAFQRLKDMTVLPAECLCGKSHYTRRFFCNENTFSIHHYEASWFDDIQRENLRFKEDNFSVVTEQVEL